MPCNTVQAVLRVSPKALACSRTVPQPASNNACLNSLILAHCLAFGCESIDATEPPRRATSLMPPFFAISVFLFISWTLNLDEATTRSPQPCSVLPEAHELVLVPQGAKTRPIRQQKSNPRCCNATPRENPALFFGQPNKPRSEPTTVGPHQIAIADLDLSQEHCQNNPSSAVR
jgi:hypothetical protein